MTSFDFRFGLVAIPTVFFIAVTKGGLGGGFSIIGVPMLSLIIPPTRAAAILAPLICFMDVFTLWAYPPRTWDRRNLRILIPALLFGILVGVLSARICSDRAISLLVGLITIVFCASHWLRSGGPAPVRRPSVARGSWWGALSGFTTFIAHSGGPPLSVYLLPQRLDKTVLAGTCFIVFAVGNCVKLAGYVWLGQMTAPNLAKTLLIAPVVPLGVALGRWLHHRMSVETIYTTCYLLLVPTGLKLCGDGLNLW
ncbi:sulfite exporter TauE/SafE family protein [Sorangium sp. So ce1078]|uniref:sulfite exporter TauE/SafE family protein n=1 Tax=Sorangium sp. So ce1078 TaxID=3133329 RepID=UPI003F5D615C